MKTILMDINLLPKGFEKTLEGAKEYGNTYSINVIPFDASAKNTMGTFNSSTTSSIQILD